jgi:SAM-dependent methyltransferase
MDVATYKRENRTMWAAGNYDAIAELVWSAGERLVRTMEVEAGEDVLDVACGTGNAAIPAADAGARVVGLDLTPELFARARTRAAEAAVEIEWVEGDAESLPFPDESFDVVLSTFGCMFAPRHEVAAGELVRVLRPGGRLGIVAWTPEGFVGDFFRTLGGHLPPLPPFARPPVLWGDPDYVRSLFDETSVELEFERDAVEFRFDSAAEAVADYETNFGPVIATRELLEPQGRWEAAHRDFIALYEGLAGEDGTLAFPAEYLVIIGRKNSRRRHV